jgi:hypothetical protein
MAFEWVRKSFADIVVEYTATPKSEVENVWATASTAQYLGRH